MGKIKQRADCTKPVFSVCDASGEEILKVEGPVCVISCCGDIDFEVKKEKIKRESFLNSIWNSGSDERRTADR